MRRLATDFPFRTQVACLAAAVALGALLLGSQAVADADTAAADSTLAPIYTEWAQGPARHLFTREDRKRWQEISSDAEAESFVRLFWARRDPLPETSDNELQREFERRAAFADQQFGETGPGGEQIRGSLTDRGRILILMGPPRRRQVAGAEGADTGGDFGVVENRRGFGSGERAPGGDGSRVSGRGGNTERFGAASNEVWVYEDEALPAFAEGAARLEVVFRTEPGSERVELLDNARLGGYLLRSIQDAVVRPDLTVAELDRAEGSLELGDGFGLYGAQPLDPSASELVALRSAAAGTEDASAALLDAAVFRASDGTWIVPLQLAGAGAAVAEETLVGELTDYVGDSKIGFRLEPGSADPDGRRFARATLVVPAGDYRLAVGGVGSDGSARWRTERAISVPAARHELWLSDLVLSHEVYTLNRPQEMFEPWTWQGVRVVPDADRTFHQGELLWYYLHVCRPQLDESSQPRIEVALDLDGQLDASGRVKVDPYQVGDDCWVLAQAYDLLPERFPAGQYRLGVTVRDALADSTISTGPVSFTVVASQDTER